MITPDKKMKRKNILTALAIIAFMIFLFFFTCTIQEYLIEQYDTKKKFNTFDYWQEFLF